MITTEQGPLPCTDCAGAGVLPSPVVLTERRLRELERIYAAVGGETQQDVLWLVGEVRRTHHALVQILAASHDGSEADDPIARKIKYLANDVLGVYPAKPT
ncbi:MAG TPA: hypothetical protein VF331_19145 [Polyangiales bacterium]